MERAPGARPGMGLAVNVQQIGGIHVGVALGSAEPRVPEHLLDASQVGAALEQVRRKRVTERVRRDAEAGAAHRDVLADESMDASRAEPLPSIVHEQRVLRSPRPACPLRRPGPLQPHHLRAVGHVGANGIRRALVERHEPLLAPLAQHTNHACIQVEIVEVEADELAQAEA